MGMACLFFEKLMGLFVQEFVDVLRLLDELTLLDQAEL